MGLQTNFSIPGGWGEGGGEGEAMAERGGRGGVASGRDTRLENKFGWQGMSQSCKEEMEAVAVGQEAAGGATDTSTAGTADVAGAADAAGAAGCCGGDEGRACSTGALVPPAEAMAATPVAAQSTGELMARMVRLQLRRQETYAEMNAALEALLAPAGTVDRISPQSYMARVEEATGIFATTSNAVRNIEARLRAPESELASKPLAALVRSIQQVERDRLMLVSAIHALRVQSEDVLRKASGTTDSGEGDEPVDGVVPRGEVLSAKLSESKAALGRVETELAELMQELQAEAMS